MTIYESKQTGIKIVYTNNILIIKKNNTIECKEFIKERDSVEDVISEYFEIANKKEIKIKASCL